jgi:hypothetical protein
MVAIMSRLNSMHVRLNQAQETSSDAFVARSLDAVAMDRLCQMIGGASNEHMQSWTESTLVGHAANDRRRLGGDSGIGGGDSNGNGINMAQNASSDSVGLVRGH